MSDNKKIDWARKTLLGKYIKKWIKKDIEKLLSIDPDGEGACNFPLALTILSIMDFLGYLVAKKEHNRRGSDTTVRIWAYIGICFDPSARQDLEGKQKELTEQFRHGLGHEYFPKIAGIARSNNNDVLFEDEG